MKCKVTVITDTARLEQLMRNIPGKVRRVLHDGVEYGLYQELGPAGREDRAHPFMTPAAEAVRQPFHDGLKNLDNIEHIEAFVDKVAHDAEGIAKENAPVDTGLLKSTITVSKPENIGL